MGLFNSVKNIIKNTYVCLTRNQMDFVGQKLAFLIKNVIFTISTVLSIIVGYYKQSLALSAYIILAGTAISAVLIIPTWPIYNKNNIQWSRDEDSINSKKRK
ncbi:microsomal signal peptidase 12 kDa subunit, putative [Plasmodium malariae]|uniref:Signal peptidase complex subunit 1 n=1 Tax=Plasmodium malariae TaxID=5858 RepID=A0A1C3KEV5_PLAMA|nr:microsomal signal peptidase 12 kDa subunit, putative [Plasmodium malariae]SBT72118.1 microsomal signal peptidase 12 kDa subunit, putative [Plasmodium malariae]SCP02620.1 microsomal signal peptidase 12 kDa subunit, putative [Plasmodium malariae]